MPTIPAISLEIVTTPAGKRAATPALDSAAMSAFASALFPATLCETDCILVEDDEALLVLTDRVNTLGEKVEIGHEVPFATTTPANREQDARSAQLFSLLKGHVLKTSAVVEHIVALNSAMGGRRSNPVKAFLELIATCAALPNSSQCMSEMLETIRDFAVRTDPALIPALGSPRQSRPAARITRQVKWIKANALGNGRVKDNLRKAANSLDAMEVTPEETLDAVVEILLNKERGTDRALGFLNKLRKQVESKPVQQRQDNRSGRKSRGTSRRSAQRTTSGQQKAATPKPRPSRSSARKVVEGSSEDFMSFVRSQE